MAGTSPAMTFVNRGEAATAAVPAVEAVRPVSRTLDREPDRRGLDLE